MSKKDYSTLGSKAKLNFATCPSLLIALAFTLAFAILAACGGGGGGSGDGDSSSSSYEAPPPVEIPGTTTNFNEDDTSISLSGSQRERLNIKVSVNFTSQNNALTTFDSVIIRLNTIVVNTDYKKSTSKSFVYDSTLNLNNFAGETCGKELTVLVQAYLNDQAAPVKDKTMKITRESEYCEIPSSSSVSSSSVASKSFTAISFGNQSTITIGTDNNADYDGVVLSTGAGSAKSSADLYYESNTLYTRSGVVIVDNFLRESGLCTTQSSSNISDPENTSQFIPCTPPGENDSKTEAPASSVNRYYLIKTSNTTASDWTTGWYLVRTSSPNSTNHITIRAWKVD